MDITGTPTFRFERSPKMKLRMKSVIAGLVIIIVIMLAYVCTLPSVQPRDDDTTNLRWLQKIIDENVKKKIEMKNLYKPSVNSNNAYPEKTKLKYVDDRAWWMTTTPDNSESTTFDLFDSKSKSISSYSESSRVETSKHLSDKTTIKNKLKKFDLPFDIFSETSSTTPSTTLTTTSPIIRYPARYPKFPKFAASAIARSFSNRLSDTYNTDPSSSKRNFNENREDISKDTSVNGYVEKNSLLSSKNEDNPFNAPNNLFSSRNEKNSFKAPNNIPSSKNEENSFNAPNNLFSSKNENNFFKAPNNILSPKNEDNPFNAHNNLFSSKKEENSFKAPNYNQINIRKQTDQNNIRKIPVLDSGIRPDKESHTENQIEKSNQFPPHHDTLTNTIGEQTANKLAQMRPNIGNNVDKLRNYKQSLLEKTLDTGKRLGATNVGINPRSPVSKSAILAEKIEKFSIQNLPKIGTVDSHEIKDKVIETSRSIQNNQNNPDNGVTETSSSIQNNRNNPDNGILHTLKEKTNKAIDKLQTNGLIEKITTVRNNRIKICKSDTTTKPKRGGCLPLQTLTSTVKLCTHPPEHDSGISGSLRQRASWEFPMMRDLQLAMLKNSASGLIDIGAGVGAYSIAAATFRRPVIAVEPYMPHVRLLQQSLVQNKLQQYVSVVCNAISDFEETLKAEPVPGHLTQVVWNYVPETAVKTDANKSEDMVDTITLDDLVAVINLTSAVLKLDAPKYDYKILKRAHMLFRKIDIPYVFMHWAGKTELDLQGIADFFVKQNYRALEKYKGKEVDMETLLHSHMSNVVWEKQKPSESGHHVK